MATPGKPVVGTAVYGPVRTVVWEDGGREAPSYPIVPTDIVQVNRLNSVLRNLRKPRQGLGPG